MRNVKLFLAILVLMTLPAVAQILLVTGDYRVTDVDKANQRFGVALREDNPNERQNWVTVTPDTVINVRHHLGGGAFRDEIVTFNGVWSVLKKGRKLKIHGGRDWDGTIVAKKIWM